jgi:cell division protein FtsW (lipid II flippase)
MTQQSIKPKVEKFSWGQAVVSIMGVVVSLVIILSPPREWYWVTLGGILLFLNLAALLGNMGRK